MWIVELSWYGNNNLLEYRCSELGYYFSFQLCSTCLGRVEVLFCQLCILHHDCAGIARQAFQYSGSVAYLFPLTVAAMLEGGAVCISDRSRLLTSNLTVRVRINYLCWQVFPLQLCHWERESVCKVYSFVVRALSLIRHMVSRLWLTVEYCRIILRHRLAQVALG